MEEKNKLTLRQKFNNYKINKLIPFLKDYKSLFYYVVFLIVLAFCFYIITIFSNGLTAIVTGDYTVQSVPFFYNGYDDWWHFFTTGEFPFWDSSTAFGADNIANNSFYYIFDPFFLVTLFLPRSFMPHSMLFSMMLRMILAALFFRLLLKYFGVKENTARLFSVCYGFGGWMLFYQWFAGFNGICTFFPLVLLGIEKVLKRDKPYILIIGLFLIGISNFYFLIPICIGGVMYALFRYFQTIHSRNLKNNILAMVIGIVCFALGILCSAFVTLPAILNALTYNRASNDYLSTLFQYIKDGDSTSALKQFFDWSFVYSDYYGFRWLYPLIEFLFPSTDGRSVSIMNFDGNRYDSLASSLFVFTPLILIFFASVLKSIRNRKWSHILAVTFFIFALFCPFFYYFFLGFSQSYGRWEIIPYAFLVLYCATSFKERKDYKFYEFIIGYLVAISLMIVCIYYSNLYGNTDTYERVTPISYRWVIIVISLIYITVLLFLFLKFYKHKKFIKVGILFIAAEVVLTGVYFNYLHGYTNYFSTSYLNGKDNVKKETEIISKINSMDDDFFRVYSNRTYSSGTNIHMAENYNGLSYFHSEYNSYMDQFLHWSSIVTSYGNWNGNELEKRPLLETFLGVKYYLTNQIETNYKVIYDTNNPNNYVVYSYKNNVPFGYTLINDLSDSDYKIYQNNNYIELGFSFTDFIDPKISENVDGSNPIGVYGGLNDTISSYNRGHFDVDQNFVSGAILETNYINELKEDEKYKELFESNYFNEINYQQMDANYLSYDLSIYDLNDSYYNPGDPSNSSSDPLYFLNDSNAILRFQSNPKYGTYTSDTLLHAYTNVVLLSGNNNKDLISKDDMKEGCIFMYAPIRSDNAFSTFIIDSDNNVTSYDNFNQMDNYSKTFRTFYFNNGIKAIVIVPMSDEFSLTPLYPNLFTYNYDSYLNTINTLKSYPLENVSHTYNTYKFETNYSNYRYIVTNLTYDPGWSLKITKENGEVINQKVYKTTGGFVGFMSERGNNVKYELNFVSSYFKEGLSLSLIGFSGLFSFVLYYEIKKIIKRKNDLKLFIIKESDSEIIQTKKIDEDKQNN